MERRSERRLAIYLPGSYRSMGGMTQDMSFSEISSTGCRVMADRGDFKEGETLELFLGPVGPIGGTVRWTKGDMAGVQFDAPLDAAIVGYFVAFIKPS